MKTDISISKPSEINPAGIDELIEKCRQNNRQAQQAMYKQFHGRLMAMCLRYFINRDDALEALNHGFLKVFSHIDQYNHSHAFEAWIYKIVQNTAIDYSRKKFSKSWQQPLQLLDGDVATAPEIEGKLAAQDALKLLQTLPDATRVVFNLFAIEGYRHEEIADMLGISAGTSKWHVSKAREILKSHLKMSKANG